MSELPESLVADLKNPRSDFRRRAVLLAAELFSQEVMGREAVCAAFADPVWCVREAAALGVSPFIDESVLATLVALTLRDSSPHVRLAAATTAGPHIQPERDYGEAVRHRFERQRIRAALALGHAGVAHAAEAVTLLALCVADSHPKVRLAGLRALVRLEPLVVVPLLPLVVRKCAEADADLATTAREVWSRVLSHPAAEVLRPLAPYPGTNNLAGVQMALEPLPAEHPLRRAWVALPVPPEEGLSAHRFARHLAAVCERVRLEPL